MSFLDHIARCNNADLSQFEPWFVGDARAGFLHRDFLPMVAVRPDLFSHRNGAWYLEPSLDTPDKRTTAMRDFLLTLHAKGLFGRLWRDEPVPALGGLTPQEAADDPIARHRWCRIQPCDRT
jgi:hypothetical protein